MIFDMFKVRGQIAPGPAFASLTQLRVGFAFPYFQGDIVSNDGKHV